MLCREWPNCRIRSPLSLSHLPLLLATVQARITVAHIVAVRPCAHASLVVVVVVGDADDDDDVGRAFVRRLHTHRKYLLCFGKKGKKQDGGCTLGKENCVTSNQL